MRLTITILVGALIFSSLSTISPPTELTAISTPSFSDASCENGPGNSTEDRIGCLDSDLDGFSDPDINWTLENGADACPFTPGNSREILHGCPDMDRDWIADMIDPDIDGDGITDTLDSRIPGYSGNPIVLDDNILKKDEPLNLNKDSDGIMAIAIDMGFPVINKENFSVTVYSQAAQMIGETVHPGTGEIQELGVGVIPFGLSSRFGPLSFSFEYRMMPEGKFEFNYWNRLYEIERISFTKNSSSQIILRTKESRLGRFGKQNGYFSGASLDLGNIFQVNLSYNNMIGNQWSDKEVRYLEDKNQTFLGSLKLKKSISRLQSGSAFYQQRNVPIPFKF